MLSEKRRENEAWLRVREIQALLAIGPGGGRAVRLAGAMMIVEDISRAIDRGVTFPRSAQLPSAHRLTLFLPMTLTPQ